VIDVDALGIDAERRESVTLRGQVLLVGGDSGIADLLWIASVGGVILRTVSGR